MTQTTWRCARDGMMFRKVRDYGEFGLTRRFAPAPGVDVLRDVPPPPHRVALRVLLPHRLPGPLEAAVLSAQFCAPASGAGTAQPPRHRDKLASCVWRRWPRQASARRSAPSQQRLTADRLAREMGEADVTIAGFPEQAIGGYPPEDLVQWRGFLDGQRHELDRFARETADFPTVYVARARRGGRRPVVQQRRDRASRPRARLRPERKASDLQRLLRSADLLARRRKARARRGRRPARRLHLPLRFRPRRHRSVRRRVVARRADAPPLLLRRRDRRQCVVVAVSHPASTATRREMLATRSSDNQTVLIYANAVGRHRTG